MAVEPDMANVNAEPRLGPPEADFGGPGLGPHRLRQPLRDLQRVASEPRSARLDLPPANRADPLIALTRDSPGQAGVSRHLAQLPDTCDWSWQ